MSFDIRETRLRNDNKSIQNLVNRSEFIRVLTTDGDPVEKYLIQFTCRGVENIKANGEPIFTQRPQGKRLFARGIPFKTTATQVDDADLSSQYPYHGRGVYRRVVGGQNA
ncbi:MAG: hypothetical protein M5U34_29695 [Chloroflexi bacterium]|nr:hypothetical protein [Chloroflexota bacterium]